MMYDYLFTKADVPPTDNPDVLAAMSNVHRDYKKIVLLIAVPIIIVILLAGSMMLFPALQICQYDHRTGTVMDNGTIRYYQNEYKYVHQSGTSYQTGDRIELCFDNLTDEYIRICPTDIDQSVGICMAGFSILVFGTFASAFGTNAYLRKSTKYGAWYRYVRDCKDAEAKSTPLPVRIAIWIFAILLIFFFM